MYMLYAVQYTTLDKMWPTIDIWSSVHSIPLSGIDFKITNQWCTHQHNVHPNQRTTSNQLNTKYNDACQQRAHLKQARAFQTKCVQ